MAILDPQVYKGGQGCRLRSEPRREIVQPAIASAEDYMLITETILGSNSQTLSITGLDGDADGVYEIEGRLLIPVTAGNIQIRPNGDTSSLKSSIHNETSSTDHASDWRLATWTGISGYNAVVFRMMLFAARTINSQSFRRRYHFDSQRDGGNFSNRGQGGGVYDDAVSNLTTLDFRSSVAAGLLQGSDVRVYKRTA